MVPAEVMPAGAEAIANANPISVVVEAVRAAMAGDVVSGYGAYGFAVSARGIASTLLATLALLARRAHRA